MRGGQERRWVQDGILYAEDDWVLVCWAPTDDPEKVGQLGLFGPKQICVEFVSQSAFDAAVRAL